MLLSSGFDVFPAEDRRIINDIVEGRITPKVECYSEDPNHPVFLRAQNIDEGILNFADSKRLLPDAFYAEPKAILQPDDIVLTIDGVLLGIAAVYHQTDEPCCISNHMVRMIPGEKIAPDYLSLFLNSSLGQQQIKRGITGSAIPGLRTDAIKRLLVSVPPKEKQRIFVAEMQAARKVREQKLEEADALLSEMDEFLHDQLGIAPSPSEALISEGRPQCFAVRRSEVADRLDPHLYHPRFEKLLAALRQVPYKILGDITELCHQKWKPEEHQEETFRYIEINGVNRNTGEVSFSDVLTKEAPSRAQMIVQKDDIIISLTRPHHGSIALIDNDLDGCIVSTGFAVVREIKDPTLSRTYLGFVLRSQLCLCQMLQRSSGGSYPAITEDQLMRILIPTPSPDLQERIVKAISHRREEARLLREEAAKEWEAARARFETQLLSGEVSRDVPTRKAQLVALLSLFQTANGITSHFPKGQPLMQAIILCGGLSTRLGDITQTVPKILLDIRGRTVLDWQLDVLKGAGVDEVILASGHLHDALYEAVGESYGGVRMRYAKEEKRLDTGGAIQNAMQYVSTSPFFVLNGDILLKNFSLCRMVERFQPEMDGLLLGVWVEDISPYGEIISDHRERITAFREKQPVHRSGYANGAIYLFNQSIANYFPEREVFSIERDVFPSVQNLYVLKAEVYWIDIGVPERLAYARQHFGR